MKRGQFFFVRIAVERKPWPFSWGPFNRGGIKIINLQARNLTIEVRQRTGVGMTARAATMECYTTKLGDACTTTATIDDRNGCLKRRTGVPT